MSGLSVSILPILSSSTSNKAWYVVMSPGTNTVFNFQFCGLPPKYVSKFPFITRAVYLTDKLFGAVVVAVAVAVVVDGVARLERLEGVEGGVGF